jgi:hypothetical protein
VSTPDASEYERFGPWVDQVHTPDEVPRLLRDHPLDLGSARLVLKVPRNIPRRDATAGMDLYDHLLVLGVDTFTVLSRDLANDARPRTTPGRYDVLEVPVDEVVAIRDVVNLLDGRLTVHTRAGRTLSIRYNGSARETVNGLVDRLRSAAGARPASPAGRALLAAARSRVQPAVLDAGREDLALVSDFREASRQNPDLVAWACHGRLGVSPRPGGAAGAFQRVLHTLSPMTLQGAVVAADDVALEVFGRHAWMVRGSKPVHSSSRLVVPMGALERLDVAPHTSYQGTTQVTLVAGATVVEIAVPDDSAAHALFGGVAEVDRPVRAG